MIRRTYRYSTFATVDLALLHRVANSEKYLVPSCVTRGEWTSAVVLALRPNRNRLLGVSQAIMAGPRQQVGQLAQDVTAVFSMEPLWGDGRPDTRETFREWLGIAGPTVVLRFIELLAGKALGDELLVDGRPDQQALVNQSRAAHQRLVDLDELAMHYLVEERTDPELAELREARQVVGDEIQSLCHEFVRLNGGDQPEIWPL